jgi:hypothetical protein
MNELEEIKIEPEALEVANTYLQTLSIEATSAALGIPADTVSHYLQKRPVKEYIDAIFMEQGYRNRFRLQSILDGVIEKKLEEMDEAELASSKDIADLIQLAHKMRVDDEKLIVERKKAEQPQKQTNVQVNNYGENYSELLQKLLSNGS